MMRHIICDVTLGVVWHLMSPVGRVTGPFRGVSIPRPAYFPEPVASLAPYWGRI